MNIIKGKKVMHNGTGNPVPFSPIWGIIFVSKEEP
jgi:hypothetical protein